VHSVLVIFIVTTRLRNVVSRITEHWYGLISVDNVVQPMSHIRGLPPRKSYEQSHLDDYRNVIFRMPRKRYGFVPVSSETIRSDQ